MRSENKGWWVCLLSAPARLRNFRQCSPSASSGPYLLGKCSPQSSARFATQGPPSFLRIYLIRSPILKDELTRLHNNVDCPRFLPLSIGLLRFFCFVPFRIPFLLTI